MKEDLDYAFLKRRPRSFLVGNPEKLGYNAEEDGTLTKDSSGIDWYSATNTIASSIQTKRLTGIIWDHRKKER